MKRILFVCGVAVLAVVSMAQLNIVSVNQIVGILSGAKGGTGSAFFTVAGPTAARTYTFQDAASSVLSKAVAPTNHGVILGTGGSAVGVTAACGTGTVLYGQNTADPICSTTTWPNALTTGDLVTATGTNAAGAVAAVASGQVLTSAGTGTVPAYSANPTVTTATASRAALATTSTDGLITTNATAATGGTTVQISPRMRMRGNAWDTAASQTVDFFMENLPTSAATPSGTFKIGYSLNGAAATYPLALTSAGALSVTSAAVNAGSGTFTYKSGGMIAVNTTSTANGQNTNFTCITLTALPANTLVTTGDELRLVATYTLSSAVTTKTYQINVGHTSCAADGTGFTGGSTISNSTALASQTVEITMILTRTGSNAQSYVGKTFLTGGFVQGVTYTTASLTDTGALNMGAAFKDSVGTSGGEITFKSLKVFYHPAGTN